MAGAKGNLPNEGETLRARRVFLDARLLLGHGKKDAETGVTRIDRLSSGRANGPALEDDLALAKVS